MAGKYNFKIKPKEIRICKNSQCQNQFEVKTHDPKIFCSKRCAASVNNLGRMHSKKIRQKIAFKLKSNYLQKSANLPPKRKVQYATLICKNPLCEISFELPPYLAKIQKFCSNKCAIRVVGRKTTSHKASKGKSGVRPDVDSKICFYSTWEANIARVYNLLGIKWKYAPKLFDLGEHTYRPDFYLPEYDVFVEVKNFMGPYSQMRDSLFRKIYTNVILEIISKDHYQEIEKNYKCLIDNWE